MPRFAYHLDQTLDEIRPGYDFDKTYPGSVPQALICFLESGSYEDTVRKAISLGGGADTLACIACSIAEGFYGGISDPIDSEVKARLPAALWDVVERFNARFGEK